MLREQDAVITASDAEPNAIAMVGKVNRQDDKGMPVGMEFASLIKGVTSTVKYL
jgi:hypothetical protein